MAHPIPEETIQLIKNAANIVDVVSDSVLLKKAGRNLLGLCPFHTEKTPSFTVSPDKQIFYCFGCHSGGNVFSFLMKHDGMTFPEAAKTLARRYGVDIPVREMTPAQRQRLTLKEKIVRINQMALSYYQQVLNDERKGQQARAYLVGRGMTRKVIQAHQLGVAPDSWDGLLNYLRRRKVPADMIRQAGLVIARKDRSGHYDRFRDRIMFPIFDLAGQTIGFGGRVMGDGLPKYLNSPETVMYNKRRSLYGINKARTAARSAGLMYVVEGYFDVLAMHLYGFENTVATLGTSLTAEHVQILKGIVGRDGQVVLVFDSDQAGIKAAQRSIPVFAQGFMKARILVLEKGSDPDSYLREHGPDDFLKAAGQALAMVPFLMEAAIQRHGLTVEGKVRIVADLQPVLAGIDDTVARSLYIKQLAERVGIEEATIATRVRTAAPGRTVRGSLPDGPGSTGQESGNTRHRRLEHQIVAMMLKYPAMIAEIVGRNLLDQFEDTQLREVAQMVVASAPSSPDAAADIISRIDSTRYRNLLAALVIEDDRWDRQGCLRLLAQFQSRYQRKTNHALQQRIEKAEKDNDYELLAQLLREKQSQAGKAMTHL